MAPTPTVVVPMAFYDDHCGRGLPSGPPLHCPYCGRFLKNSGSKAIAHPIIDADLNWGTCKVHGEVEWQS